MQYAIFLYLFISSFLYAIDSRPLDPTPYLLPKKHHLTPILRSIFSDSRVVNNSSQFKNKGFTTISFRKKGALRVAKHPKLQGYLIKLYLVNETWFSPHKAGQMLIQRCRSAQNLRTILEKYKIKDFTVPKKWLYKIPKKKPKDPVQFVLIVEDMQVSSYKESTSAWQNKMCKKKLQQLYKILSHGYGSIAVVTNIPYTKRGTFSFIDCEYPQRIFQLNRVARYLSKNNSKYWNHLINSRLALNNGPLLLLPKNALPKTNKQRTIRKG